MKRAVIAFVCALSLLLSGCFGSHSIKVVSGQSLIDTCPRSAKAGEVVTVYTAVVTDGDVIVHISGAESGSFVQDGVYEFTMPEGDVEISVSVKSNGLA